MAWSISISAEGWEDIREALHKQGKRWLFQAVNEAKEQRNEPTLQGLFYTLAQETLADCAYELIEQTNTCDNGGFKYWIDPKGYYKVTIAE